MSSPPTRSNISIADLLTGEIPQSLETNDVELPPSPSRQPYTAASDQPTPEQSSEPTRHSPETSYGGELEFPPSPPQQASSVAVPEPDPNADVMVIPCFRCSICNRSDKNKRKVFFHVKMDHPDRKDACVIEHSKKLIKPPKPVKRKYIRSQPTFDVNAPQLVTTTPPPEYRNTPLFSTTPASGPINLNPYGPSRYGPERAQNIRSAADRGSPYARPSGSSGSSPGSGKSKGKDKGKGKAPIYHAN